MNLIFKFQFLLCISVLFISCHATKSASISSDLKKGTVPDIDVNKVGYIEMGMIAYEITDSTQTSPEAAKMMIDMMSSAMNQKIVYNNNTCVELILDEKSQKLVRKYVYNKKQDEYVEFLYTSENNFYHKTNIKEKLAGVPVTEEDSILISKMIIRDPPENSKKDIFGYKCTKITMMQADDLSKEYVTFYLTDKIPYMGSSIGPLGDLMNGMPLLTIMNIPGTGIRVTIGALNHSFDPSKKQYLEFDPANFVELDEDTFNAKKNN